MRGLLMTLFFSCFVACTTLAQSQKRLLPDFGVVQYAGSIGYFSAGFGYTFLKENARFSAHFGTVPENRGGTLSVISTKLYFKPATFTVWNRVRLNPFDIGVMASYHYGDNFQEKWPEGVHPKGYYWWHPAFRTHLGMESSLSYEFKKGHSLRSITGYVEFNTNELYFVSFIKNVDAVSFWDIIKVGTGVRVFF
jgi:hypothetical protein